MNAGIDGELVRKLRTVKSWSQEELGQISGLSARTIQRIEAEGSSSLDSRRALASAFGLGPEDLLTVHRADPAVAQDGDQAAYVDRPQLGGGYGAVMGIGMGVALIAMVVAFTVATSARNPVPGLLLAKLILVGAGLFIFSAYWMFVTANTTYRLSAKGLEVRFGPHHRNYRWDEFAMAHRQRSAPLRLSLQPVTRFLDVVTLEARHGGRALDLTPHDSADFMRQIAALAPQLAPNSNP